MTTSRSECPICAKLGTVIQTEHWVTCPAYRGMVHMAHCRDCPYHRSECSIDWCAYKTREQKIKEKLK